MPFLSRAIGRRRSALVVDDSPEIADLVATLLQSERFDVICVSSGKEALAKMNVKKFDLLITDIIMPEIDGLELIMGLRKLGSRIPVVAMSGGGKYISPCGCLHLAKHLGAHVVLQKPFNPAQFFEAVKNLMPVHMADER